MNLAQPRLPYRKPTIERITLVGEEIAAVPNCKRDTGGEEPDVSQPVSDRVVVGYRQRPVPRLPGVLAPAPRGHGLSSISRR